MRYPLLLLALWCHLTLGATYLVTAPVFEAPDERGHAGVATFVAEHGRPPMIRGTAEAAGEPTWRERAMAHHPPAYYYLLAATLHALDADDLYLVRHPNPLGRRDGQGRRRAQKHAHGWDEVAPASREVWSYRAMRAWSLLFGAVSLVLIHRIGLALVPDRPLVAGLGVALLASAPRWWMAHGVLDNGNPAVTFSMGALLVLVHATRAGRFRLATGVGYGLLAGLALLSKLTAIGALPIAAFAWGRALLVERERRRETLVSGFVALGVLAVLVAPFFARNVALYGELFGTAAHEASYHLSKLTPETRAHHWRSVFFPSLLHSWTGGRGQGGLGWPLAHQLCWLALLAAALGGYLWRGRRLVADARLHVLALLSFGFAALLLARYNLTFGQAQSRYLFAGIGPAMLLGSAGLVSFLGPNPRRAATVGALVVAASSFVLLFADLRPDLRVRGDDVAVPPWFAVAVLDVRTPAEPARQVVEALAPDDGAELEAPPTFRWRADEHGADARWTLLITTADGRAHGATYEMTDEAIEGGAYAFPPAFWDSFERGATYAWRVRRLPDRRRGERTRDALESEPRTFVRR